MTVNVELCEPRSAQFGSPYPHILGKAKLLRDGPGKKRISELRKCSWCGRTVKRVLRS